MIQSISIITITTKVIFWQRSLTLPLPLTTDCMLPVRWPAKLHMGLAVTVIFTEVLTVVVGGVVSMLGASGIVSGSVFISREDIAQCIRSEQGSNECLAMADPGGGANLYENASKRHR